MGFKAWGCFVAAGIVGAACGGRSADPPGGTGVGPCTTIAPAPSSVLPHVTATGAKASRIQSALQDVFASQSPPFVSGASYSITTLSCGDIDDVLGDGSGGYACELDLPVDGGPSDVITLDSSSLLAAPLMNALTSGGAASCNDSHGIHVDLTDVLVSGAEVGFDEQTNDQPFPTPNVVVRGGDATAILSAFTKAGIVDCDSSRKVFLVCTTESGSPSCATEWLSTTSVGGSELIAVCGPAQSETPGVTLAAAASQAVWQALLTAAGDASFQPTNGALAQTTVLNARYFSWDGTSLGFTLVTGDGTPPP